MLKETLKLSINEFKIDIKLLPKILFDATISTWKSTSEIDFDLAQKINVTVQNSVTPIKPAVFKMNTHVTEDILLNNTGITHILIFHLHFREIVILSNL